MEEDWENDSSTNNYVPPQKQQSQCWPVMKNNNYNNSFNDHQKPVDYYGTDNNRGSSFGGTAWRGRGRDGQEQNQPRYANNNSRSSNYGLQHQNGSDANDHNIRWGGGGRDGNSESHQHQSRQTYTNSNWNSRQRERNSNGNTATNNDGYDNGFRSGGDGRPQHRGHDSKEATVISVPSSEVGRLIGKGGSKIRELQDESGANIRISKNDDGYSDTTTVQLSGPEDARKKAEELIQELINSSRYPKIVPAPDTGSQWLKPANDEPIEFDWAGAFKNSAEASKERWKDFPPIIKNFYIEDPEVASMNPKDVAAFRKLNNNITVTYSKEDDDRSIPNPVTTFEHAFSHYPDILDEISKQGFEKPSPIQAQAWPILLRGYDMIGIAQTGTGKTLAFLLPAFIHIENQKIPRSERQGPNVLIMAPTRELALQIEQEILKFNYKNMKSVCVYGGGNRKKQIMIVTEGVEIIIATPGRLNDLIQLGVLNVSFVTYLVLDEADRMLDMGFEPQIRKVLVDINPDRQTIMTSATWPEGVRRLAKCYMSDPLMVFVGTLDLAAVHSVQQIIEMTTEEEKLDLLMDFIRQMCDDDKVIVFVGRKSRADHISSELSLQGVRCQCIHGDREQCDREQAIDDLKTGYVKILIATDVASRGIDIKDITYVLNYDFPRNIEEYVHRVGRTGRAGKTGTAVSWMTREDWSSAEELIKIMEEANQEIPPSLVMMAQRFRVWKDKRDEERAAYGVGGRSGGGGRGRYGGGGGGGFDGGGFGGGGGGGRRNNKW